MTTAQDLIAAKLKEWFSFAGERMDWEWDQYAYVIEKALIDAPESVRLELARQLCPIMIAAFRQIIEINDRRTLPPDWEGDTLNDACQAAKKLLPAPPSEDK